MFIIFAIMLAGVCVGYWMRRFPKLNFTNRLIPLLILLLLFLLGVAVGGNEQIMNNLHTIGWRAFVLSVSAVAGSVLVAWWVYTRYFKQESEAES